MRINYYSFFRFVIAAFLIIGTSNVASAQIKIGANGAIIAPSSILELESNNQGLLLPRLTDTVAINTLNPPNGMIIYLTKWPAVGLYVRKTTGWEFLTGSLGGNGTFNNLTVGGTLIAQNFSGNLIGNASTATLATTATNAVNVNITNDLSTSTVSYPTFVTNTPGSTSMRTSSTKLSFVPNTGILTAIGFKGNLVGDVTGVATSSIDAVNASNTDVEDDVVSNSIQYPTFVTATNGNLPQKTSSTNLTYIPLTGELKALKFNGPLQGNASSATQAQDAVNSQNSRITDDMVSSVVSYPVFVNSIFGNQPIKSSSSYLTYVPSTGILTAKGFVGNLTGDVTGTVSNAKDADNAAKIQVVENSISTTPFYPTFVSGTVGPLSATINSSKLKYIPATGEFFSPIFKGELIGNASTTTTATNAANVVVTDDSANSLPTYPVFVNAITGNQAIKSSSSNLSYVPSTGILTAKGFVGNLVGDVTGRVSNAQDADNAAKIQIAEDAISNVPVYPTFVTGTVGPLTATINSSKLKYIPSTGELIAPVFKGELVGNASTTTTATNAANVLITDDVSNSLPTYPVFVNAINGNQAVKSSSTNLSYVPSTGILTAKGFVGNLVGNVTGEVSNALNAVNAANINVSADDISAGTVYPVFVSATTGSLQPKVSSNFLGFKPLTGELTAPTFRGEFIGNATTSTSTITATNSVNSAITDDNSNTGTFFPVFVGTASGNQAIKSSSSNLRYVPSTGILSATGFAGPLVGNVTGQATSALSAVSATNATTADNALKSVIIDDTSHSLETYPLFVNNATGNQPLRSNGINLKYIPSTGTLKAKEFVGNLTGNLNGIASNALESTNSANVSITDDLTSNAFMPLTFVTGNSGSLPVKVSSSELTFNPSLRELKSEFFRGDLLGNANTATTISPTGLVLPVNGGTGLASYAPGDILYAENSSTLKKLPVGAPGTILRVNGSNLPSWSTSNAGTVIEVKGIANRTTITGTPNTSPEVDIASTYAGQTSITTLGTVATGTWQGSAVGVQYGGTGLTSIPTGSILIGNGTGAMNQLAPDQAGKVLTSNGPGLAPSYKDAGVGDMILNVDQTVTGTKLFGTSGTGLGGTPGQTDKLRLAGRTESFTILNGPDSGTGGTVILPQSGTLVTLLGNETLSSKTLISPTLISPTIGTAIGTSLVLGGGTPLTTTNQTGTGSIVMSNNPQLTTPNIGNATGSSLNVGAGTITAGSFVGNLNGNISGNANNVSGIVQIANGGTGANTKQTGFDNLSPMTSPGDMIYGETLGSARRLALGGANQVLKGGLTAPQWGSVNLVSDVTEVLPTQNGGTGNAFTEFTGPFITKKVYTLPNFDASLAVTNAGQTFTGTQIFTSTIDGNISSATTATKLAATKNINGVPFDGSADIIVNADASTLTGATLKATVLNSNLTSVGTLTNLTVTNPIVASITGNAATATTASTVTTNANLTGEVTSVGNLTSVTNNAVITKILTGYSSAAGVVSPADNIVIAISKLSGNIAASGNATHTGDVEGATNLTIKDGAVKTSKIDAEAVTLDKIKNVATNTVLGRATGGTGTLEEISTIGTGNVVRATSPTLVTPNIGAASATSLTVSGIITSNIADGNAPFVVTSTTPVTNLSVGGKAGSATKLATARAINGVDFDGTGPITITAAASTLTGNTLNPAITTSSLTSVGTLGTLTVTNPIVGSVTGNASNVTGTVLIANGGTGASTQQGALNALVGTQSANKFLRSDGANTTLSNIQTGDIPTLNQNTTGTAAGLNDAYIDWNAISGGKAILNKPTLKDGTVTSVAALTLGTSGTDLSSTVATNATTPIITLNVPTASATNRGALSTADWTTFNAKQSALSFSGGLTNSSGTVTVNSTQNIANLSNLSSNGIVSTSGGTGTLAVTPVNGTGNVVLTSGANLVNPNIGSANGTSLTLTGSLTSTATTGTAPFVVSSTTPVNNLNIGGNAATATKLATARTINGISFDGSADIAVPATGLTAQYIDWDASSGATSIKNKPIITNGTVTSVAATVPSFLTITGSPITTNGTLAISYNTGTGLPVANGGTGLISLTSGGALYASSANSIASGTLPTTAGGTGQSSYLVGDMLYASTTSALSRLPSVAVGNALISNGVGVAPSWGKIDLSTHIQGTIPISLGGTGSSTQNFVDITANQTIQGVKTFVEQISGSISGNAGGNAATATKLAAAKTIYGNAFDGSVNLEQVIAPAFGGTGSAFARFVGPSVDIKTYTLPTTNATLARTDAAQSFNGVQSFNETIVGSITGNAVTATTASALIASATINSPTLVTPILGTATATSINKVTITDPTGTATLSLANNSTLATSGANSITLTSTGPTNVTLPTSGTLVRAISFEEPIDFGSVAAGASEIMSVGFVGTANPGDVVSIGLPDALASAEGVFTVWFNGSVKIKFTNTSTAPIDLPSGIIKFKIFN